MSKVVLTKPAPVASLATLAVLAALLGCGASGCNLNLDLDAYPYHDSSDSALVPDVSDAEPDDVEDAESDIAEDADAVDAPDGPDVDDVRQPGEKPSLIFTELMPDSSTPPDDNTEYGEYIEIKNVGTAPADPRRIIIQLSGSDRRIQVDPFPSDDGEREIFEGLEPIEPGEYFVFLRQDDRHYNLTTQLADGTFYEYGRWFDAVPLSNASRRLQLSYRAAEFELVPQDAVEWAANRLIDPTGDSSVTLPAREDIAWGVRPDFEDAVENNDPAHWCFHVDTLIASPVKASPGRPTPADCVGEE